MLSFESICNIIREGKRSDCAMWKCEKCGHEFSKQNKEHYCGQQETTIDTYIASQPEDIQPLLNQVRNTIREVLPDTKEKISWSMPTFYNKHSIIHFAAFKNHIGIYPGAEAMEHFAKRLTEYKTSKGALQLPYSKPLPLELIAEIAEWCYGVSLPPSPCHPIRGKYS